MIRLPHQKALPSCGALNCQLGCRPCTALDPGGTQQKHWHCDAKAEGRMKSTEMCLLLLLTKMRSSYDKDCCLIREEDSVFRELPLQVVDLH